MNVLVVSRREVLNPFSGEIANILSDHCQVIVDLDQFWEKTGQYDLLLFQWPEELFKNWSEPTETDFDLLVDALRYWSCRSKLYIIRHNLHPHYRFSAQYLRLYDLTYSFMDGVVHLGQFSKVDYLYRYPDRNQHQKQLVIPHPLYTSMSPVIDKSLARERLNIPRTSQVVLVFGSVRNYAEYSTIMESFDKVNIANKFLLISSVQFDKFGKSKLKSYFNLLRTRMTRNLKVGHAFIPSEAVSNYLSSADVILIPRQAPLNSGNLPLGFQFQKVVVGPNYGNVGEILSQTGNPTFYFDNSSSVARALEEGAELANRGKGIENYNHAMRNWSHNELSKKYLSLLSELNH